MTALATLLAEHDRHLPPRALETVLGDGYLLTHSALYRNVRELVGRAGFRISDAPPFPYFTLKLLSLDDVFDHRCLAYVDNVTALRRVERRAPGRMTLGHMQHVGLPSNMLLHESVHCIVRLLLRRRPPEHSSLDAGQQRILDLLFEESCANAVELLYSNAGVSELDRAFLQLNSYHPLVPGVAPVLEELGFADTLRLLVVSYLYANFLYKEVPKKAVWAIYSGVVAPGGLEKIGRKAALRLFRVAEGLNPLFRVNTTGVNLRYAGFDGSPFELLAFDFSEELASGRRLRRVLEDVVRCMELGVAAPPAAELLPPRRSSPKRDRVSARARA